MDCSTRCRILHPIWERMMNEQRRTAPYLLHEFGGRKEREWENGTTKQKHAKSNCWQFKMSHAEQHAHDKSQSQHLPKSPRAHDIPMRSAQQWTRCLICCTPNNPNQSFSATVWLFVSRRVIDRSQKCGVAVHNWVLVKWRSAKHTSLPA